jgi:translation initiation factor IF-3
LKRPRYRPRQYEPQIRVNNRIRAREVRVIGGEGGQLGVMTIQQALQTAREAGLDLVEISPKAVPPVCRIVDFGKFKYEQAKQNKDTKKSTHANKVKEIQLRPAIDPHDFQTKAARAIDFLCEDMKVKINLRFRGRENAHKEIGFGTVKKFAEALAQHGSPDFQPKLIGRGINLMISPLPRDKRAPNPRQVDDREPEEEISEVENTKAASSKKPKAVVEKPASADAVQSSAG